MPRPTKTEATDRERLFLAHWLRNGCNGTQAMLSAGITDNRESAASLAARWLRRPRVIRCLQEFSAAHAAASSAPIDVTATTVSVPLAANQRT